MAGAFALAAVMAPDAASAQQGDAVFADGFEPAGAGETWSEVLAIHNDARELVSPPADPALEPLRWDAGVAATAQASADRCQWSHSSTPGVGENLYARTGDVRLPGEAALAWVAEASDYDYASNSCASGETCGHYTQIVWRSTTSVGCAMQVCPSGGPWSGTWTIYVCQYAPRGNYLGERPY